MAGVDALKRHGVPFNALVTVNRTNARFPLEVYRFVTRELGATYVQFNPCVEPVDFTQTAPHFWRDDSIPTVGSRRARPGDLDSIVTDWSVDPDDWGRFPDRNLRRVGEQRPWPRTGQSVRNRRRPDDGSAGANLHHRGVFAAKGSRSRKKRRRFLPAITTSIRSIKSAISPITARREWLSPNVSRLSVWVNATRCPSSASSALT